MHLRHFWSIRLKGCSYKPMQFTECEILKKLAGKISFNMLETVTEWGFICEVRYKQENYSNGF